MEVQFPVLLDGATGTELQKMGYDGTGSSEEWVLSHPEAIKKLQGGYIDAGSQIVLAPTFGANRVKLEERGVFDQVGEYNEKLVSISRKAVGQGGYVAGDMTTLGQMLYPVGEMRFEDIYDVYREQAEALEKAGVDLFIVETLMALADARAAVLAIRSVSSKPIFVTFTCEEDGRTMTGSDVAAILQVMQGMEIDAFGLNCSVGPDKMLTQIRRLHEISRLPLIAKPNAGLPVIEDGKTVYPQTPDEFTVYMPELAEAGVEIFGGCCGTDRNHIAAMHELQPTLKMTVPAPEKTDKLPCASGRDLFFLDRDVAYDHVLRSDESLEDNLDKEADYDNPLTAISIKSEDDLVYFEEQQSMIDKPLCIVCDDPVLLEKALRLYQGRPLYDGNLPDTDLLPLVRKYGVII